MNRQNAWVWRLFAFFIVFASLLPVRTWAQDDNSDQYNDPPARVARLNFAQGSVSFQPGGEGDWVDAIPNRPISSGDNLWTDRNSRAELHVGSTSIRLGSETSVTFLDLDDHTLQLRVAQGTTMVRLLHMDDDDLVEIDTPNIAFQVNRPGEFRVDVRPDGHTTILDVSRGRGQVVGGGNTYTVVAGQQAVFTGDDNVSYDVDPLPNPDDLDRWGSDLDRREDQSQSANYVSNEMTGYEDLDDNGNWSFAGGYGPVWYPAAISAGWAPYRFGHWIWVAPWGWTWVDDARWGFAPFHYGRWAVIGGRWGWIPGPVAVHPVYAPALVAFVGGGGFALGGGAGVAWFPLGPGEVFVPSYHVSRMYVTQVNVTNTVVNVTRVADVYNHYTTNSTTVINRITYMNQTAPNALTAVSRDTFVNARPVAGNVVAVQARDIAQAPVTHMAGVEPVRSSVIGAGKPTSFAPPAAVVNRQVVAQHMPAQPPTPFAQRQDKLVARPAMVRPVAAPANARQQQPGFAAEMNRQQQPQTAPKAPVRLEMQGPPPPAEPARTPAQSRAAQPAVQQQQQQAGWSHPQARPAPPVTDKTPQQKQQDEAKYQSWQQKQQQQQPQKAAAAPAKAPEPSGSKKH
ncbi:MAG: DUF6600 domain-containing protein [Terriglobales bacterium]